MKLKKIFFLRELVRVPMLCVFLAMVAIFGFKALGEPAEIDNYAIVTALGVDLSDDDEFDLSLLMFVPQAEQSFAENYKMITSTGKSMSEAIDFAGLHVGKEVGLTHIKFVVLSEEIVEKNISLFLDYLVRNIQLSASTKVIVTDGTAKEFIEAAQKLDTESAIKVSDIITYNRDYIYATDSSMETFFKGTYGPTRVGLLSVLSLEEAETEGIPTILEGQGSSGGGGGSGASGQSASEEGKKEILNDGDVIVCKDGKRVAKISGEDLKNINLLRGEYSTGSIEIYDFTDEVFQNANLIFEIFDNTNNLSVVYENGVPVINIDMALTLRLSEVQSENEMSRENVELFVLSDAATDAVEVEVKHKMARGIEIMRENQTDIADFYTYLYNKSKGKFLKFLDGLDDAEAYLDHIVFKTSVRVYAK